MVVGIAILLVVGMLLTAAHVTRPKRLRFSLEIWRVALRLEVEIEAADPPP